MRREKAIQVGERTVSVRELTLKEIRAWLADASDESSADALDFVGMTVVDGVTLEDLARMTDLTVADMDALTPSEVQRLADVCREVNPGFFRVAAPLHKIARAALENYASRNSNAASPRSSAPATRRPGIMRGLFSRLRSRK